MKRTEVLVGEIKTKANSAQLSWGLGWKPSKFQGDTTHNCRVCCDDLSDIYNESEQDKYIYIY